MGIAEDRDRLQRERARLARQAEALRAEHDRLDGSGDLPAIRALVERLRVHRIDLREFHRALDRFHQRFGPLDRD